MLKSGTSVLLSSGILLERQVYASASLEHSGLKSNAGVHVGTVDWNCSSSVFQVGSSHVNVPDWVYTMVEVDSETVVQSSMHCAARGYPSQSVVSPG